MYFFKIAVFGFKSASVPNEILLQRRPKFNTVCRHLESYSEAWSLVRDVTPSNAKLAGNLNAAGITELVGTVAKRLHMFRFHFVKRKCQRAQFWIVITGPKKIE